MAELIIDDSTPNDVLFDPSHMRGGVPRDLTVDPPEMFADPSGIKLIPRSEWSARIREMKEQKSRLSDIRMTAGPNGGMIPSLDQNGQGFCADEKTEVLTEKGFVPWPQYNWSDLLGTVNQATGALEFQKPFEKHVYEYDGEMVVSTNRRVNFSMTPDHRMYVRKWDESKRTLSSQYTFQRAGDLGWYAGLMAAPTGFVGTEMVELAVEGDRSYDGDDFVAMLSLIVSDGYAGGSPSTKNWVSFCCFREDRYNMVAALAQRVGFKEQPGRRGVWSRYNAGALANWIRSNCYVGEPYRSVNKKIPDIVKWASSRQIGLFLKFFGDQDHAVERKHFYTSSTRVADDIQELFLRIGKRATITGRSPRTATMRNGHVIEGGPSYEIHVAQTDRLCLDRKEHLERDRYKGLVYCAAVPNGTLVTRRNGTTLISGNCWAYSVGSTIMAIRAVNNVPYVRISPHAVACKIKGFRDEGGWCGLSAKFARETGYPSDKFWPQKSMSRSHDNAETWANAALHKITEDWVDLSKPVYDQSLTFDMVMSCLLQRIPCALDFYWWSHSVAGLDPEEVEPGSFGIRIWNSWTDGWSENGTAVLRGDKSLPNGAVATRGVPATVE